MNDYEITVQTDHGQVCLTIKAENYESADAFANQMNQGFVYVNEVSEDA